VTDALAAAAKETRRARFEHRVLWGLAALAAAGLLGKFMLDVRVAGLESTLAEKQQFVNQTLPISRLNGQLVQTLANVSARTGDQALSELLAGQGIQFSVNRSQ